MTKQLHPRHGTALMKFIATNVLAGPRQKAFGIGIATRNRVATTLSTAFLLHIDRQPITCQALVNIGCGSTINVRHALELLVDQHLIITETEKASHQKGHVTIYRFSTVLIDAVEHLHNGPS
jgi:hypothetical protein